MTIIEAKYVSEYTIFFRFSDNTEKVVDFGEFLRNSSHQEIRKYLDVELFQTFKIVNGDIDWGDFDLCFPISDLYYDTLAH